MKNKISFNSPVIHSYVALCFIAFLANQLTNGAANRVLFSVYSSSLADVLAYPRLLLHVVGHASWEHLLGNMMYVLLLGPMLE